jgi:GTP-binding protein
MAFLGENGIPFAIIFTKTDKLASSKLNKNITKYKKDILKTWEVVPTHFITSSETEMGKDDVINFIEQTNVDVADNFK